MPHTSAPVSPSRSLPEGPLSSLTAPTFIVGADPAHFRALYRDNRDFVSVMLSSKIVDPNTRDDLAQEVWSRAFVHFDQYDRTRGSFRNWLGGITHHTIVDYFRKSSRRQEKNETDLSNTTDENQSRSFSPYRDLSTPSREDSGIDTPRQNRLDALGLGRQILERLPQQQADVLTLMYVYDLGIVRTAKVLGIPEGTAKSRLNAGLKRARKIGGSLLLKAA